MRQGTPEPEVSPRPSAPLEAVERVVVASDWNCYLSLRALAAYSSLSERMLRGFLRDPMNPLPHYRVGGRVLVRRSDFDRFIEVFREGSDDAEQIADRILESLDQRTGLGQSRGAAR